MMNIQKVLSSKWAHVVATAVTSFVTAVLALHSFNKAGIIAAAVAAVHAALTQYFPATVKKEA